MNIIIGALQAANQFSRLIRCRETWMANATALGIPSYFLIGAEKQECPSPYASGDFLLLPCPNPYPTLPQRTYWFCRWAMMQDNWDYLFKCDSDTYISIPRLAAYDPAGRDYIGGEWQPGVGYGSGGGGYLLSRKAAAIVAEKLTQETGAEDLLVGQLLKANGIPFSLDNRFVAYGNHDRRPRPGNDLVTLHGVEADLFWLSHKEAGLDAVQAVEKAAAVESAAKDVEAAPPCPTTTRLV